MFIGLARGGGELSHSRVPTFSVGGAERGRELSINNFRSKRIEFFLESFSILILTCWSTSLGLCSRHGWAMYTSCCTIFCRRSKVKASE